MKNMKRFTFEKLYLRDGALRFEHIFKSPGEGFHDFVLCVAFPTEFRCFTVALTPSILT